MVVTSIAHVGDHRLAVAFSDGSSGEADFAELVTRAPFSAIRSARVFSTASIEAGAVEWPGARIGIATESLYALVHGLPRPATLEDARANEALVAARQSGIGRRPAPIGT